MSDKALSAATAGAGAKKRMWGDWALTVPALLVLALFLALPLVENAFRSIAVESAAGAHLGWSLRHYQKLFTDSYYLGVLATTLKVSAIATLISLFVGYPLAYFMVRHAGRLAVPLLFVLVMPLLTSIIMRTFGWRVLFARRGIVSDLLQSLHLINGPLNVLGGTGIVYTGMVHVMAPFMVLSIVPVLRAVDTRLEESARILGAGAWKTFFHVTLPLSIEGVLAGCVLVFMLGTGSFLTMLLLGDGSVTTLPLLIFQQFTQTQDLSFAAAMGNLLLMVVLVCLYVQAQAGPRMGRTR